MDCFYAYMLKCSDQSYYVGRTKDIERRLAEHRNRQAGFYTARRLPVELVFFQTFAMKMRLMLLSSNLKGGREQRKKLLLKVIGPELSNYQNRKLSILRQAQDE